MPYWTTTSFPGPFPWLEVGGFPAPPPSQGKGPGNEVDWAIMRNLHGGIPSQRCRILFFSSTSMQNHHSTKLFCCPCCDGIPHSENNTRVTDWREMACFIFARFRVFRCHFSILFPIWLWSTLLNSLVNLLSAL